MDESWLLPYSDMLTLLLALFIVLFSMSSIDADKYNQLKQALNSVFNGGSGVLEYYAPDMDMEDKPADPQQEEKNQTNSESEELKKMQSKLNGYIQQRNLEGKLKTSLDDEGLLITISDEALFSSGSAEMNGNSIQLAKDLSSALVSNPPRYIVISGHTDNVPIHNAQYKSNWHLSVMRAINFMDILMQNPNLDAEHFSAKGYGEYKPVVPNDTPQNRAKNRRVEVLVLPYGIQTAQDSAPVQEKESSQ